MTDAEIIKALECCASRKNSCNGCPMQAMNCTPRVATAFALDLINRQQAEIERLKEMVGEVIIPARGGGKTAFLMLRIKALQAEAIGEFAERLKEEAEIYCTAPNGAAREVVAVSCDRIDNLVREIMEDTYNAKRIHRA